MVSITCQSLKKSQDDFGKRRESDFSEGLDIIITKPLGTGVAVESFKLNILSTENLYFILDHMTTIQSQIIDSSLLKKIVEIQEVTGYGLLGALEEAMLRNNCGVRVDLAKIPAYPGVLQSIEKGVRANLHAQNKRHYTSHFMNLSSDDQTFAELLFDPQTAGPLVLFANPENSPYIIEKLRDSGLIFAHIVGQTTNNTSHIELS